MRVIFASLFFFVLLAIVGIITSHVVPSTAPQWILGAIMVPSTLAAIILTTYLFNRKGISPRPFQSDASFLAELEQNGLLSSERFFANRAFQVEEFEDEGSHYFIELQDSRVLYLSGQYLYDYEPLDDPPETQVRSFPTTEFIIRRHKIEGHVIDIIPLGSVIEPEFKAPHFAKQDFKKGLIPEDGQIFTDISFEQLISKYKLG
jgi:hypothetical protein